MPTRTLVPDQDALRRVGAAVRQRLESDPGLYRVPTDKAEIFAAAGVEFDQKGGIVTTVGDLLDGLDRDRALIDALRVCNRGGGAA